MHALDILGDPVRRKILEELVDGEKTSGELVTVISKEFGITQPAVSHQLRVLREHAFTTVRPDAQRRIYSLNADRLLEVQDWLVPFSRIWDQKLMALETEIGRGKTRRKKGRR